MSQLHLSPRRIKQYTEELSEEVLISSMFLRQELRDLEAAGDPDTLQREMDILDELTYQKGIRQGIQFLLENLLDSEGRFPKDLLNGRLFLENHDVAQ